MVSNDEGSETGDLAQANPVHRSGEERDTTRTRFPFTPPTMPGTAEIGKEDPEVAGFNAVRGHIKAIAKNLHGIKTRYGAERMAPSEDRGEVLANLTLAYRCLEDASMRMGKAIQARDGGVSVYDRATTVGA